MSENEQISRQNDYDQLRQELESKIEKKQDSIDNKLDSYTFYWVVTTMGGAFSLIIGILVLIAIAVSSGLSTKIDSINENYHKLDKNISKVQGKLDTTIDHKHDSP